MVVLTLRGRALAFLGLLLRAVACTRGATAHTSASSARFASPQKCLGALPGPSFPPSRAKSVNSIFCHTNRRSDVRRPC
jgi:hypothetical protein